MRCNFKLTWLKLRRIIISNFELIILSQIYVKISTQFPLPYFKLISYFQTLVRETNKQEEKIIIRRIIHVTFFVRLLSRVIISTAMTISATRGRNWLRGHQFYWTMLWRIHWRVPYSSSRTSRFDQASLLHRHPMNRKSSRCRASLNPGRSVGYSHFHLRYTP